MKTIIVYHHPCTDGLTAAASAYLKFRDTAVYIKHSMERNRDYLNDLLPLLADGDAKVYFLDCAPVIEELPLFGKNQIQILDHHLTNMQAYKDAVLPENVQAYFEMNKSGAGISWDHFHPEKLRPMMIAYVEDRDLWKFKYESTRAFNLGLALEEETLQRYSEILTDNYAVVEINKTGRFIEKYVDEKVLRACKHNVKIRQLSGFRTMFINATENISDVGNKALDLYPNVEVAAVYQHYPTDNTYKVSMRSRQIDNVDVGALAKKYRGGGHRNSSGCVMTNEEFMELFK